ncbi:MAG TPA: 3-isopropylmalate dehydratase large subunit [Methylomirabilota bacterium]|nr:3-isopropylmalate dehydratase large subunit [Methylomirabilota bacterium]
MARTLLDKVWEAHTVRTLPSGQTQLLIGLHLIHEVTTPQAFQMLKELKLPVRMPERTFGTLDHIIPTADQTRPYQDPEAEEMAQHMYRNMKDFNLPFFDMTTGRQGIVHVIGPELGLTQPGMTIACGDSHTSTHGAVGAIAFGIGTTQVRDVLATQCLAMAKPKLRQVRVEGALSRGVYAKDVILTIINRLGVKGGVGYAYEYAGAVIERMTMEERLTLCNMSIEGGARFGYVNPDQTTFDYLRGRPYAPQGEAFERAVKFWAGVATEAGAAFDDVKRLDGGAIEPVVTWGINPEMSVGVTGRIPAPEGAPEAERPTYREALAHMGFTPGQPIKGAKIDVAFVGSCTNGRLSDLRVAAEVAKKGKVAKHVRALIVPGSQQVARAAEAEGLHEIFQAAGFQWRKAGCSMCLGMNDDKLQGREMSASSSNRNFIGRQGSPTGRTLLMSPAMVAAAAISGEVADVREILK